MTGLVRCRPVLVVDEAEGETHYVRGRFWSPDGPGAPVGEGTTVLLCRAGQVPAPRLLVTTALAGCGECRRVACGWPDNVRTREVIA